MIVGDAKPSLDELQHFGVPGMKWGVRRGSVGDRFKGALADRNQRRTAVLTRIQKGPTTRFGKLVNETDLRDAKAQRKRLDSGKLKTTDYLEMIGTTNILDLMVSRRDARG